MLTYNASSRDVRDPGLFRGTVGFQAARHESEVGSLVRVGLRVLDPPEPLLIRPLATGADRLALLDNMLAQAGSGQPIGVPTGDAAFRDRLMQLAW
jgi:hypothetical protein